MCELNNVKPDSMGEIKKTEEGAKLIVETIVKTKESYGDVAKSVTMPEAVQKMLDKMPLQSVLKQAGKAVTPAMVKEINHRLNHIPKLYPCIGIVSSN